MPESKAWPQFRAPATRFGSLPEPVALGDTIATHDPSPPPDPVAGRDPERDFMLRYALL